jgi:hypothetical protein
MMNVKNVAHTRDVFILVACTQHKEGGDEIFILLSYMGDLWVFDQINSICVRKHR